MQEATATNGQIGRQPSRDPSFARWLVVILILAAVFRVGILVYAELDPGRFDYPDSRRYVIVAQNIAAGLGPMETDEVRAGTDPLYPTILAFGVWLGCNDVDSVFRFGRIVNALFGLASVALLALFARRLVSDRAALLAAVFLAVDPLLLFFHALVLTETGYILFLLAGFYGMTRLAERRTLAMGLVVGMCLGLGSLMRSSNLLMPIALLPMVWAFSGGRSRRRVGAMVAFLFGAAILLLPTVIRNYGLFDHFVPVHTSGGASLMEAWGPWADGSPGMDRIEYPVFPPGADEYVRDQLCREAAFAWAAEHPMDVLSLALAKLRRTWSITINAPGYSSILYELVGWLTTAPEFALALVGAFLLRRRRSTVLFLLLPAIYFTLLHMVFVGSVRYRIPAMPFLFVLAGVTVADLWRRIVRPVPSEARQDEFIPTNTR